MGGRGAAQMQVAEVLTPPRSDQASTWCIHGEAEAGSCPLCYAGRTRPTLVLWPEFRPRRVTSRQ